MWIYILSGLAYIYSTLCATRYPEALQTGGWGKRHVKWKEKNKAQKWMYKKISEPFLFFTNRQSKFCSVTILWTSSPFSLALYACICAWLCFLQSVNPCWHCTRFLFRRKYGVRDFTWNWIFSKKIPLVEGKVFFLQEAINIYFVLWNLSLSWAYFFSKSRAWYLNFKNNLKFWKIQTIFWLYWFFLKEKRWRNVIHNMDH